MKKVENQSIQRFLSVWIVNAFKIRSINSKYLNFNALKFEKNKISAPNFK